MLRILPGLVRSTGPGFIAGALSFAVAVAWIPWLEDSPDADVPRYTLLMLAACAGLWMPFRPKAEHWLGLAFIAWAAVSLAWTTGIHDGIGFLVKFLMLAGLFAVGNGMPSLKPVYVGLGLGFALIVWGIVGEKR